MDKLFGITISRDGSRPLLQDLYQSSRPDINLSEYLEVRLNQLKNHPLKMMMLSVQGVVAQQPARHAAKGVAHVGALPMAVFGRLKNRNVQNVVRCKAAEGMSRAVLDSRVLHSRCDAGPGFWIWGPTKILILTDIISDL